MGFTDFTKSVCGNYPTAIMVSMIIMILIIIILIIVVIVRGGKPKFTEEDNIGAFVPGGSSNFRTGNNMPLWHTGFMHAGYGGSMERDPTLYNAATTDPLMREYAYPAWYGLPADYTQMKFGATEKEIDEFEKEYIKAADSTLQEKAIFAENY